MKTLLLKTNKFCPGPEQGYIGRSESGRRRIRGKTICLPSNIKTKSDHNNVVTSDHNVVIIDHKNKTTNSTEHNVLLFSNIISLYTEIRCIFLCVNWWSCSKLLHFVLFQIQINLRSVAITRLKGQRTLFSSVLFDGSCKPH